MMRDDIAKKLNQFKGLQKDWNGYDAEPLPERVIDAALLFLEKLRESNQNIDGWEVFPTARQTVQFEKTTGRSYIEVEIYKDGRFVFYSEREGKKMSFEFTEENKTVLFEYIAEMQKEIDELKQKIQTLEPLKIYLPNLPQDGNFDLDDLNVTGMKHPRNSWRCFGRFGNRILSEFCPLCVSCLVCLIFKSTLPSEEKAIAYTCLTSISFGGSP